MHYEYVHKTYNLDDYQTVFASVPGSVEMTSAGRAFTWEMIFRLKRRGIRFAYLQLHTGLSYFPNVERFPLPIENSEPYVVPAETVIAIEETRAIGGRVIAVGTTVVRALESAIVMEGTLKASSGWTNLHIHPEYSLKVAQGLITGLHEPEASHLDLLSAFISRDRLQDAYQEAIREQYLWHEFGDMNLIL